MINTDNIGALVGSTVVDSDGDRIGTVGQVYVDPDTGRPNWVTVRTGLFGMKESFVPLDAADQVGDDIRVPHSKDDVKDAPRIDHDGALEEHETDNLYSYYEGARSDGYTTGATAAGGGLRAGDDTPGTAGYTAAATGPAGTGATTGTPGTTASGGVSGAAGSTGTGDGVAGRPRLRRYVATDDPSRRDG